MNKFNEIFIEDEIVDSYLNYAMSVIIGRALPDARDGLKPVHRRTLFAMKELNNRFNKNYKKSARIVGDVIGKYHPHGEIAVYDSIVRLSQSFTQRYPLIDGQGNFGSIDGDSAAAMRYTEIRMAEIAEYLLNDLDFSTVDYVPNYDNTEKYPLVLPTMIPNLLVNGSCGIAVGMATNIPPHNLSEVIDGCIAYLDNPTISIDGLMKYILGPDFPTYASICGIDGISNAYKTGKGRICIKAKAYVVCNNSGKDSIIIEELPYQVNKAKLIEQVIYLIKEKKVDGIKTIRDESDKDGLRIFIEILKGRNSSVILNKLYSLTKLQTVFNVNMVALVDNSPKLLNLKDVIKCFIDHRKEVIYRRTCYKLSNLESKLHILEGFFVALLNIDVLIGLITMSRNIGELKIKLSFITWQNKHLDNLYDGEKLELLRAKFYDYKWSKNQIKSILDLKLSNLIKLERDNIVTEYFLALDNLSFYKAILDNDSSLVDVIRKELLLVKNKFGDIRRTKINLNVKKLMSRDLVFKESIIITLSNNGYIKLQFTDNYHAQHRGGKGKLTLNMNVNDFIKTMVVCNTHGVLLYFSNFGRVYWMDLHDFPLSTRLAKGVPIINFLSMKQDEKIHVVMSTRFDDKTKYFLMVTRKGLVKKVLVDNFKNQRIGGVIAIDLLDDDSLVDVKVVNSFDNIMLFSNIGKVVSFSVNSIRCTGRASRGVNGMRLGKNEHIVSLIVSNKNAYIVTATQYGFGKRTKVSDYPITNRGGKGVRGICIDKKNGDVAQVEQVFDGDDLLLITKNGIMSRINISEIPCIGRNTKGVVFIKLSKRDCLVCIKRI